MISKKNLAPSTTEILNIFQISRTEIDLMFRFGNCIFVWIFYESTLWLFECSQCLTEFNILTHCIQSSVSYIITLVDSHLPIWKLKTVNERIPLLIIDRVSYILPPSIFITMKKTYSIHDNFLQNSQSQLIDFTRMSKRAHFGDILIILLVSLKHYRCPFNILHTIK